MATREILFLRQGRDEPPKSYYRIFKASISSTKLAKCTPTTSADLKKTYAGDDDDNSTKRFHVAPNTPKTEEKSTSCMT